MQPNMNELLEECRSKAETLVGEINNFRSAATVNNAAADNLQKVAEMLKKMIREISPFIDLRFRRFRWIMISWSALNTVLLLALIIIGLMTK
jgi:hypothetical protein